MGCAASIQADLVLTSSTSCLVQMDDGLRKYYPDAEVKHLSEYIVESLEKDAE